MSVSTVDSAVVITCMLSEGSGMDGLATNDAPQWMRAPTVLAGCNLDNRNGA